MINILKVLHIYECFNVLTQSLFNQASIMTIGLIDKISLWVYKYIWLIPANTSIQKVSELV